MTNYQPITYQSGDFVTVEKKNTEMGNTQHLFENQVDVRYNAHGIKRDTGMKIMTGNIVIPAAPTSDYVRSYILFGGFFTSGTYPVVTATPMTNVGQRLSVVVSGFDRQEITDAGFMITVCQFETNVPNVIVNSFRVNYIAIGY